MQPKDRRARVIDSPLFNGIDFVEVASDDQKTLRVHFLNAVSLAAPGGVAVTITGGERIPTVSVGPIDPGDWSNDTGHMVLTLRVTAPGDFSTYTLTIASPYLDSQFRTAPFTFKARCPSDVDCRSAPTACPVPAAEAPLIDYLAKDFLSFRRALLDFSALRYPEWQERSEADFGMMLLEALCSLADDLSYTQDRIAAEAALETATQRRSVVRLARLVDYEPRPATVASVLLQFDVTDEVSAIPHGSLVIARRADGTPIPFETGPALYDRLFDKKGQPYTTPPGSPVRAAWNRGVIRPYLFDDSQRCLPSGAVEMYVLGNGFQFVGGQPLLIETAGESSADPPLRQIVYLLDETPAIEECDPLYDPPSPAELGDAPPPPSLACSASMPGGTAVTRIRWRAQDALTAACDLRRTTLAGNLIAATQALTQEAAETFLIPPATGSPAPPAVVRTGPNDAPGAPSRQYLWTLRGAPLAWLAPEDPMAQPQPEVVLTGPTADGRNVPWTFLRSLLAARATDPVFTVDAARFSPVSPPGNDRVCFDYDGDTGDTLRFGDGVFGAVPLRGSAFHVTYRVGGGAAGNVAADAITEVGPKVAGVIRVRNPLPASGGDDAEPLDRVRRLAPQAFRAVPHRAVLPADYEAAAKTLPWVQRAGTAFRWTGSWLTVFTTPDPRHGAAILPEQRAELIDLLNRYRMAGYESYVPDPRYVSLDLLVQACARPDAFRRDVQAAVQAALASTPGGFFDPDKFTFGQPLRLSALEAAIQNVNGVAGVTSVQYRIRGRTRDFLPMGAVVPVGPDEVITCNNAPNFPEHGSLRVTIQGGK